MTVKTIDLKGKAYAQVKDRIKQFREENPNGLIETFPTVTDTNVIFKAHILKDKANAHSAEATGHSYGAVDKKDKSGNDIEKVFEKQETIAIGRALAMLGYLADGEIASSEEMEEFEDFKKTKQEEYEEELKTEIDAITSLEELRKYYANHRGNGAGIDAYITEHSKKLKNETA